MSQKVCVQSEIRDSLIMKDTLSQLGIQYTEANENTFVINEKYNNTEINCDTGKISFDHGSKSKIDKIKKQYSLNFYRDQAIREGMHIEEKVDTNGEIILRLYR